MHDTPTTDAAHPVTPATVEPPPVPQAHRYPIRFTGSGSEYFRIWIVNLLLTIVTFGIYSAWAKVRKLQYFYRNTQLDGSVFDYHGRPLAILKGRVIALVLFLAAQYTIQFSLIPGIIAIVVFAVALPWLIAQSQRFKLHNTSYRGLRFRFSGSAREMYLIFGIPMVAIGALVTLLVTTTQGDQPNPVVAAIFGLGILALYAAWPYGHYRLKRWQHSASAYGHARSSFRGEARGFYKIYGKAVLVALAVMGALFALLFGVGFASSSAEQARGLGMIVGFVMVFVLYGMFFAIGPWVMARVQNYVWNRSLLGLVGFDSQVKARRMIFVAITNLLLIVITLGLYTPFAAVRMYRLRVESVTVMSTGDLAGFVAHQGADVGATGEGAADILDFDFAL